MYKFKEVYLVFTGNANKEVQPGVEFGNVTQRTNIRSPRKIRPYPGKYPETELFLLTGRQDFLPGEGHKRTKGHHSKMNEELRGMKDICSLSSTVSPFNWWNPIL